jgi:transcription initiation factor TFIID subunit 11
MSSQVSAHSVSKRPKLHPLAQTSFPAHDASGRYDSAITSARSETGSVANSLLSGISGRRGRGRPRKSANFNTDELSGLRQAPADSASQTNGENRVARNGTKSAVSGRSGGADQEEDDDPEADELLENMDEQERINAEEEELNQERRRKRLGEALDEEKTKRYEIWRAVGLSKSTLKRLVNSVVSQSVTEAPLLAIRTYGKWFVGEIVERAREVQIDYANAYEETARLERVRRKDELAIAEQKLKDLSASDAPQQYHLLARDVARLKKEVDEYVPNPHKGGLLPDHLREALRRYKADGEGGGVGFQGMSHGLLGVPGSAAWRAGEGASGNRIFR